MGHSSNLAMIQIPTFEKLERKDHFESICEGLNNAIVTAVDTWLMSCFCVVHCTVLLALVGR